MKLNVHTSEGLVQVNGKRVSLIPYPGYSFFVHKSLEQPKLFVVSEYKTGRRVSNEYLTREDAIKDAIQQIEQYGIHRIKLAIENCISEGTTANGTDNEL